MNTPSQLANIPYNDEEEVENSHLQRLWNDIMEPAYKNPLYYQQISVLLISWDEGLDDLNIQDEVCLHLSYKILSRL